MAWSLYVYGNQYVPSTLGLAMGAFQPFVTVLLCTFVRTFTPFPYFGIQAFQCLNLVDLSLVAVLAGLYLYIKEDSEKTKHEEATLSEKMPLLEDPENPPKKKLIFYIPFPL